MKAHLDNLQKSYEVSSQQIDDVVSPLEIAAIFESEEVAYALIGGHMLAYYTGRVRATVDVVFIIGGVDFERTEEIIRQAYAQFRHHGRDNHVTYDTKEPGVKNPERIDLIKDGFPLFSTVVGKYCKTVTAQIHSIKIPTIEAAIALKFAASISPNRSDEDKLIDNADLLMLVRTASNLDKKALIILGELIYGGGGKELTTVVRDIKQGKATNL